MPVFDGTGSVFGIIGFAGIPLLRPTVVVGGIEGGIGQQMGHIVGLFRRGMADTVVIECGFERFARRRAFGNRGICFSQEGFSLSQQAFELAIRCAVSLVSGLRLVVGVAQDAALAVQVGQADVGDGAPPRVVASLDTQA